MFETGRVPVQIEKFSYHEENHEKHKKNVFA